MYRSLLLTVAVSSLCTALPARADFEGQIEMKMTARGNTGVMKMLVGKPGIRNEMEFQTGNFPMKMVVLFKKSNPDTAYTINDTDKTYAEIDMKKARETRTDHKFTAKKLGTEKINGWQTVHALVTDDKGNETEVWTNNEILDWKSFINTMTQGSPANEGMMKALKDVGAEGFFVKLIGRQKGQTTDAVTMELVKADKKKLPASTFEIPSGYKKADSVMGGAQLPPEIQRQLMEKMKSLTPEQQEQMRKALQGQGQK
jgi:hypothetical protein